MRLLPYRERDPRAHIQRDTDWLCCVDVSCACSDLTANGITAIPKKTILAGIKGLYDTVVFARLSQWCLRLVAHTTGWWWFCLLPESSRRIPSRLCQWTARGLDSSNCALVGRLGTRGLDGDEWFLLTRSFVRSLCAAQSPRHLNENKITKYEATNKDLVYLYVLLLVLKTEERGGRGWLLTLSISPFDWRWLYGCVCC